jgi:hypothetical protein
MALEDVLTAATVRPVHIGLLDIKDAPLYGWSGPGAFVPTSTGDSDLDGNVFLSIEGAVDISDITEDQGIGGPLQVTFAVGEEIEGWQVGLSALGEDQLGAPGATVGPGYTQIIDDRRAFIGRKAKLWLGFLSADESSVLPEIEPVFSGVMVSAEATRQSGQVAAFSITCDQDTQKARSAPVRWIDHAQFYPSDTASSFINSLSRGSVATAVQGSLTQGNLAGGIPGPRLPVRQVLRG